MSLCLSTILIDGKEHSCDLKNGHRGDHYECWFEPYQTGGDDAFHELWWPREHAPKTAQRTR